MNKINWKIIFALSIFGLGMGIASISLIPENLEPLFWLVIFIISAYVVAKNAPGKYFLHGLLISILNSVWITASHVLYATTYVANHPNASSMNVKMPLIMQAHQRSSMIVVGLPFGILFGLILGIFCLLASKMVKKGNAQ